MTINWRHAYVRGFLLIVAALIVIALVVHYLGNRSADATQFKQATKAAHVVTQGAAAEVARIVPVVVSTRQTYASNRASVLANNPTAREVVSFQKSDAALLETDRLQTAQTALVAATASELKVWQNPPTPPRLVAYGEAMYDVIRRAPVARLGLTARVIGPVSLSAAGEYAAPSIGNASRTSALVGVRITF